MTAEPTVAPFGTWASTLDAAALAEGAIKLSDLRADGRTLWWLEARPAEGGRQALVRWADGESRDVLPDDWNCRTRVHEYGGAAFAVRDGVAVVTRWEDQRLYRLDPGATRPVAITPEPPRPGAIRYADGVISPDGRWMVCVREVHGGSEPRNDLVAVALDGSIEPRVLAEGGDFYAWPRLNADGTRLCYTKWDHPDMPWDRTSLWVSAFDDGHASSPALVADDAALYGPLWAPDGALLYSDDRTGYWNLHRWTGAATAQLTEVDADIGHPQWQFGNACTAFASDGRLVCVRVRQANAVLGEVDHATGSLRDVAAPYTVMDQLCAFGDGVAFVGASPALSAAVVVHPLDGEPSHVREIDATTMAPDDRPRPEALVYPTTGGATAHAFFYPPHSRRHVGPDGELPPLVVRTHGGPTGHTFPQFSPVVAFWTSRGFAVVDVNYRGSTGYGRAYREALRGNWGVYDVDDAVAAARFLAERGAVDPGRMTIEGGSAGGFTTLACLVRSDNPFAAGADFFGVADLVLLAEHTHKFESRYLDSLIGPYPQERELYVQRSPLSHVDQLTTPVIVLQGLDDEIVPPEQSEAIAAAARDRGVASCYLAFPGEQHGFRRAEHIVRAFEAQLAFYGVVLGFQPDDDIAPPDIANL